MQRRGQGKQQNAQINFKHIADVCLSRSETLAREWFPDGVREGHEWSALNPVRNDRKRGSFKINLVSGKWCDFASGEKGGDFISLYAYLHNLNNLEAAKELADQLGLQLNAPADTPAPAKPQDEKPREWLYIGPVPDNAPPPPVAHVVRGKPDVAWTYRSVDGAVLGYIWRFTDSEGGKEIVPLTLWKHATTGEVKWRHAQFPEPRPLYGLERLKDRPDAKLLIVEGEKCADAGHGIIGDRLVVLSWPGGGKALHKANWAAINGRNVITWADCDAETAKGKQAERLGIAEGDLLPEKEQPGVKSMRQLNDILLKEGCKVREVLIPKPGEKPKGWDIADAVQVDGWDAKQLWGMLTQSAMIDGGGVDEPPGPPHPKDYGSDAWRNDLLWTDGRNARLLDCRENVFLYFMHHPELKGLLAWDVFGQRVIFTRPPPWKHMGPLRWVDDDDAKAGFYLSAAANDLRVRSEVTLKIGARMAALENPVHPVREYLRKLKWDGEKRLDSWISKYMNAADSDYMRAVSRFSLVAMVARVMEPGCWCRALVVFIDKQNKGKSKIVAALCAPWNADTPFDLHSKDSFQMIQGIWGYEISEMDAFSRADQNKVKAFISSPTDRFRAPYGRETLDLPRQTVFWGSANDANFILDQTGGTRYWPADVHAPYDLAGIIAIRDQLYAEAVAAYDAGEKWWPENEGLVEQFTEHQDEHTLQDAWAPIVARWIDDDMKGPPWRLCTTANNEFCGKEIQVIEPVNVLLDCLKIEAGKISGTQQEIKRVERVLLNLGCERKKSGRKIGSVRPRIFVRVREPVVSQGVQVTDDVPI